jgi:hypothetical protein
MTAIHSNPQPNKRQLLQSFSLEEILREHIPILQPTVPDSFLPSNINRRTWGLMVYKLIQDPSFSSKDFIDGSICARSFVINEFNHGGYSNLSEVSGPRFLEACRNTHLLGAELRGRINYEIKEQTAEIFNVAVLDSIIPSMGDWEGQTCSTAFDSAESAIKASVQRMLAIDVKYKAQERFQIFLRDEDGENGASEFLLNPKMADFREEIRIWRFERTLDNRSDCWIVSDVSG